MIQSIVTGVLYLIYLSAGSLLTGYLLLRHRTYRWDIVTAVVSWWVAGTVILVPLIYAGAVMAGNLADPILTSGLVLPGLMGFIGWRRWKGAGSGVRMPALARLVAMAALMGFSVWMMTKTFKAAPGVGFAIGSNEVFDFGHLLSVVRSFSLGGRVPLSSPFVAGAPEFYHYMFAFWASLLEKFGLPIVWAVNIPSIISMTAFLYLVAQTATGVFGLSGMTGAIAVLLTVTHPTLAFFEHIRNTGLSLTAFRGIWRLAAYPFAGPFDGSIITVFATLNVFVNQRHLAIALSAALLLCLVATGGKGERLNLLSVMTLAAILFFLPVWHIIVFPASVFLVAAILIMNREYRAFGIVGAAVFAGACVWYGQWASYLPAVAGSSVSSPGGTVRSGAGDFIQYVWQNFGVSIATAPIGVYLLGKRYRKYAVPFLMLSAVSLVCHALGMTGIEQKLYNVWIIGWNVLSAVTVTYIWNRRGVGQAAAVLVVGVLTVSGFMDLMVIKNDFLYPVADVSGNPYVRWIARSTPKDAVFVSYQDMFDPVIIAGRRNFYGFFRNVGQPDRRGDVKLMYEGSAVTMLAAARKNGISYIAVPKWKKDDFPYAVDIEGMRASFPVAYEDTRHVVFTVR